MLHIVNIMEEGARTLSRIVLVGEDSTVVKVSIGEGVGLHTTHCELSSRNSSDY